MQTKILQTILHLVYTCFRINCKSKECEDAKLKGEDLKKEGESLKTPGKNRGKSQGNNPAKSGAAVASLDWTFGATTLMVLLTARTRDV